MDVRSDTSATFHFFSKLMESHVTDEVHQIDVARGGWDMPVLGISLLGEKT